MESPWVLVVNNLVPNSRGSLAILWLREFFQVSAADVVNGPDYTCDDGDYRSHQSEYSFYFIHLLPPVNLYGNSAIFHLNAFYELSGASLVKVYLESFSI